MPETNKRSRELGIEDRVAVLRGHGAEADRSAPSEHLAWLTRSYFEGRRRKLTRFLSAFGCKPGWANRLVDFDHPSDQEAEASRGARAVGQGADVMLSEWASGTLRDTAIYLCRSKLVSVHERLLTALADEHVGSVFADRSETVRTVMGFTIDRLWAAIAPTIALDYNLFCMRQSVAPGAGPEAVYLRSADASSFTRTLFDRYPVLAGAVDQIAEGCCAAAVELMRRLASDRAMLDGLGIAPDARVTAIRFGAGDSHNGGRAVCIVEFGERRIVYKPRPLSPEVLFGKLTRWLAETDERLALTTAAVVDRGEYGYCAFVQRTPSARASGGSDFYRRMGVVIAAAYLLGMADLHFENVIAVGDDPVLVDIESILLKPLRRSGNPAFSDSYCDAFADLLFHSLLLPLKVASSDGVADPSAIGSAATPSAVGRGLALKMDADGETRFVAQLGFGSGDNRPATTAEHAPYRYLADILDGYEAAASAFTAHADELGALLETWARDVRSRWIPRPTRVYTSLLERMRHPSVLGDAIERDFLAASLWTDEDRRPVSTVIIRSELRALRRGDVPSFWTSSRGVELDDGAGATYETVFASSGMDAMMERLSRLADLRVAHRAAIIASVESTRPAATAPTARASTSGGGEDFGRDQALASAEEIGRKLVATVHLVDGMPFWSGLHEVTPHTVGATVLLPTVYDGSLGIGLFIAALQRVRPAPRWLGITRGVHRLTCRLLADDLGRASGSAFSGFAGSLYTNLVTSSVLGVAPVEFDPRLDRAFGRWTRRERNCDYVGGLAGAIVVLLRYYDRTSDDRALARLRDIRRAIVDRATCKGDRYWWRGPLFEQPLGGFAHGTAGIAWALALTQSVARDPKIDTVIDGALRHDDDFYREDIGGWIDGRHGQISNYWCHGAAGIGLAAKGIADSRAHEVARDITARAHRAVLRDGALADDCLCHGTLGNAELLLAVDDREGWRRLHQDAHRRFLSDGVWSCVGVGGERAPGLFCGLSGIGHQMLRFAAPDLVPNVLQLGI